MAGVDRSGLAGRAVLTAARRPKRAPARIVFGLADGGAFAAVRELVAALDQRGLAVHLAFDRTPPHAAVQTLLEIAPRVTIGRAPARTDAWADFAAQLRLDGRADSFARLPPDAGVVAALSQLAADLYVTTAAENPASVQPDHLLAARALGVPSLWLPLDWTRSRPFVPVDAAVALNDSHACDLAAAGVPEGELRVVGAPAFDAWFEAEPATSRREFLESLGATEFDDYVLYAAATSQAADRIEPRAFLRWLEALRAAPDPAVANLLILVRPDVIDHDTWRDLAVGDARVLRIPAGSVSEERLGDPTYLSALAFAAGVVTTAPTVALQAALVGQRPILLPSKALAGLQASSEAFRRLVLDGVVALADDPTGVEALAAAGLTPPIEVRRLPAPAVVRFLRPTEPETSPLTRLAEVLAAGVAAPAARRQTASARLSLALLRHQTGVEFAREANERRRFESPRPPRTLGARGLIGDAFADGVWPAALAAARKVWPAARPFSGRLISGQLNADELRRFARAEAAIAEAVEGESVIVVGPCLLPVSLEVGYWVPFLRWWRRHHRVDPSRVIVLGRGGTSAWYEGIGERYVDLFDLMSPQEYRGHMVTLAAQRRGRSPVERALELRLAQEGAARLGVSRFNLLSPAIVFDLFDMTGQDLPGRLLAENFTRFDPLPVSRAASRRVRKTLPKRYIAVKFHANAMLGDTKPNRAFLQNLADRLSERRPVVALGSSEALGSGRDFIMPRSDRILRIDPMQDPARNLEYQTAVLAGAEAVFATYGGIGLAAAAAGQNVFLFADRAATPPPWMDLAERRCAALGQRPSRLNIEEMPYLDWVAPRYVRKSPEKPPPGDENTQ